MVRLKHRYFLVKVIFNDNKCGHNIDSYQIFLALTKQIKILHGDFGLACTQSSLNIKYVNAYTSIILIRVRRQYRHILSSSLPFITALPSNKGQGENKCFLQTLHVAGTIRSCQKALICYHRKQLKSLLESCTTEREQKAVEKSLLESTLTKEEDSD